MLTISIDTTEVDDLFARLRQRLGDLSPAMRDIAEAVMPRKMLFQIRRALLGLLLQWGRGSDASEDTGAVSV